MKKGSVRLKVTAIVPSAGRGKRFESKIKKPLANLNKRPLLSYALNTLQSSLLIRDIVLVVDKSLLKSARRLVKRYNFTKVKHIIEGGRTRTESVRRGLRCVDKDTSLVLIHDGARPFASKGVIKRTIAAALKFGASLSAIPVTSTIKVSGKSSFVKYTPRRKNLWEAQTPQVFRRNLIEDAYKRIKRNKLFTDDAALIENIGKKVKIVKGDYSNIKITTIEDIKIAEALLKLKTKNWESAVFL